MAERFLDLRVVIVEVVSIRPTEPKETK